MHLLLAALVASASALSTPVVGVLEDPQCKDGAPRAIRPLFAKSQGAWEPLTSEEVARPLLQSNMTWSAVRGGKTLTNLRSGEVPRLSAPAWTYPRDYLLATGVGDALPEAPNKSKQFMGWCAAPVHNPVALVSPDSAADPDRWAPLQIETRVRETLYDGFRMSIGSKKLCYDEEDNVSEPYNFAAKDLRILQSLGSQRGHTLVAVTLVEDYTECQSELGGASTPRWFLLDGKTTFLGEGLEFVDSGDYDGDGMSEVLFWYSGYNRDGYVLFSRAFKDRAEFLWSYH